MVLWKIFEWYSCVILTNEYNTPFYNYEDISIYFKEKHNMSKEDTGIDCCNLIDTIVQAKLRKNLGFGDCATFFAWQNEFNEETHTTVVKWPNMIITRPDTCRMSKHLILRQTIFRDYKISVPSMINYCNNLLNKEPIKIEQEEIFDKRSYQENCRKFIWSSQNAIINLPTGSGKNYIMIMSLLPGLRYLILVPRIIIMDQIKEELIKNRPEFKNDILTMGDNSSVYDSEYNIIICVYNSVNNISDFSKFNQIFIDEAHNIKRPLIYTDFDDDQSYNDQSYNDQSCIETNTYKNTILSLSKYKNNIYMSATIDKEDGFRYFYKSIRSMIDANYLVDYLVHVPIFGDLTNDYSVCAYLIENYRSIIIYCSNRAHGLQVCRFMNQIMEECCEYVDCKTTRKNRKKIIDDFKNGLIPFLVNVRVLTEGFNAPIANGVCFLHMPSNTKTEIQILGRALRLHHNKSVAHIIMPYVNNSDVKSISVFLRELAENDPVIKNSIKNKDTNTRICIEKCNDLDTEESIEILDHKYDLIYDSYNRMINRGDIWLYNLNKLKKYIDTCDKRPVEKSKDPNIKILGTWLSCQLTNYKKRTQIMKETEIYNKFKEFLTEYICYFPNTEI